MFLGFYKRNYDECVVFLVNKFFVDYVMRNNEWFFCSNGGIMLFKVVIKKIGYNFILDFRLIFFNFFLRFLNIFLGFKLYGVVCYK